MALSPMIIWCDNSFAKDDSYKPMKDEFQEETAASSMATPDPIDMLICNAAEEDLSPNGAPLITVATPDEAMREIERNGDKKIFFISSGTLGRYIVPEIVRQYPCVHSFYIYCHNMALHVDWATDYIENLQMFNHQVDLLVRLTRDIAAYFIEQGRIHMSIDEPKDALVCFNHARTLEIRANARDKMAPNTKSNKPPHPQPDVRERLDLLEGDNGLIRQAERALYTDD